MSDKASNNKSLDIDLDDKSKNDKTKNTHSRVQSIYSCFCSNLNMFQTYNETSNGEVGSKILPKLDKDDVKEDLNSIPITIE